MEDNVKSLLDELEKQREAGKLSDADITDFNKTGGLNLQSSYDNVHYDELNKTGQNYEDNAKKTANALSNEIYNAADKQTNIEKAASAVKNARSDATRAELLKTTGDFKDKQDKRYNEVSDITKQQENIANRQANINAAKAGKYGDIYSDGALANIKNDVINKYGQNILNAKEYALNTNRTIDNDLLNVGLKELADKDKRDAFKNILLDKENSYMLNAISEASAGNKQAIKDVDNFYKTYIKEKANNEATRAGFTEKRAGMQAEYDSLDAFGKASLLKDQSSQIPGYGLIADRIPDLINKYPNLSLAEIQGKVSKIAELALTGKQQIATIGAKAESQRTQEEKDIYNNYLNRGLEEQQRSDRHTSETIAQQEASSKGETKSSDPIYDNTVKGQQVIKQSEANKEIKNQGVQAANDLQNSVSPKKTVTKDQLQTIRDTMARIKNTNPTKYKKYETQVRDLVNKIKSGEIIYNK